MPFSIATAAFNHRLRATKAIENAEPVTRGARPHPASTKMHDFHRGRFSDAKAAAEHRWPANGVLLPYYFPKTRLQTMRAVHQNGRRRLFEKQA